MKRQMLIILAILLMCGFTSAQNDDNKIEVFPLSYVMPVIVSQPDCPIQIEKFIVGKDSSGRVRTFYKVHNNSEKTIKSYMIARWYSDNAGYIGYGEMPADNSLFMPKQKTGTITGKVFFKTNHNKKKKMEKIAFIMIIEVHFNNGTEYSDEQAFLSLQKHLNLFSSAYE